jgi:hypothetical protein
MANFKMILEKQVKDLAVHLYLLASLAFVTSTTLYSSALAIMPINGTERHHNDSV